MALRFCCVLVALVALARAQDERPRVTVEEGTLVGVSTTFEENTHLNVEQGIDIFLGVPFADPPVRFSAPTSKAPWTGDYDASQLKPACLQKPSPIYPSQSEDCLYLNVFVPNPKPVNASVMVWIHGGGFSEGTAMSYAYNGIPLVGTGGGDVIVVTINYRLGIFATFTTKDEAAPGNYGMLDQVAALKWIYNNIGAFGGDRNRITLFGESAGGASVGFHLLSKLSRGYFNQAIMQSGSPLATWAFIDSREYEVQKIEGLAEVVGCEAEDSSALVECLREIDGSELRQAAEAIYVSHYVTLDGTFLEDTPVNLLTRGDLKRAAVLSGYTADEGTFFSLFADYPTPPVSLETFRQYVKDGLTLYEITNEFLHNAVLQEYTDWTVADDPEGDQWRSGIDFMGDTHFACPAEAMHKAHAAFGDAVFTYYMTFVPTKSIYSLGGLEVPSWFGAGHADDIPLVFGWVFTPEMRIYAGFNVTEAEAALSAKVMKFWTNFAKSGDPSRSSFDAPSGEGQDSWPVFTVPELRYKELSYELGEGRALNARRCSFWNQYFANLLTTAPEGGAESSEALHEWEESFEDWKDVVSDWKKLFAKYKQRQCN